MAKKRNVIDEETGMIRNSPAGKFATALGWVMDRSDKLLESCRTREIREIIDGKVHQHVKYLYENRMKILEILMIPNGKSLNMNFRKTHLDLVPLVKHDAFETSTRQYQGRRRPIDMFYRDLNELYQAASRCDQLYNDRFQSDKFSGIVLERLRWIKTIEDEIIKIYEGKGDQDDS